MRKSLGSLPSYRAKITCARCQHTYQHFSVWWLLRNSFLAVLLIVVCSSFGALIGASIGIATGGLGMVATIPLAIVGAAAGLLLSLLVFKTTRCPNCKQIMLL